MLVQSPSMYVWAKPTHGSNKTNSRKKKERMYSTLIVNFLTNFSFLTLFLSMVIYWIEISNITFSSTKLEGGQEKGTNTSDVTNSTKISFGQYGMFISNISIFFLLILRWKESGHFPLSNLYESLMFLSWTLTTIHIFLDYLVFWGVQMEKSVLNSNQINKSKIFIPLLLGSITSPSALLTNAFATFSLPKEMQEASPLVPALQSNWLMMHVTVMILSYGALILGSLLSVAFLVITQEGKMPSSKWGRSPPRKGGISPLVSGALPHLGGNELSNLNGNLAPLSKQSLDIKITKPGATNPAPNALTVCPKGTNLSLYLQAPPQAQEELRFAPAPLRAPEGEQIEGSNRKEQIGGETELYKLAQTFDNLSYRILGIGFPFLTIGILSGAVWANEAWGSYWSWDPKETWALLTWLVFAIYLHTRLNKGWEGRRPALIATLGLISVWICYLGVNLLGEGLHSYGWFTNSSI